MKRLSRSPRALAALLFTTGLFAATASAQVRITEWMYSGNDGEFIEFTNVGTSAVDMAGWSFDDDSRTPFTVDLSAFGTIAAGESVILTEVTAEAFRTAWGLDAGVKVIGGFTANLGRADEINLFDPISGGTLADRLTFGDQVFSGSIRTQNASGWARPEFLGANTVGSWVLATEGDVLGSYASVGGDIGNPGVYFSAVPEPASAGVLLGLVALAGTSLRRRRR